MYLPDEYLGKCIQEIKHETVLDQDKICINFTDGTGIRIFDDERLCCESRYMETDDPVDSLIGATFIGIDEKDGPTVDSEYDGVTECQFLEVQTDKGFITFAAYNEHNGYYSGFDLQWEEKEEENVGAV